MTIEQVITLAQQGFNATQIRQIGGMVQPQLQNVSRETMPQAQPQMPQVQPQQATYMPQVQPQQATYMPQVQPQQATYMPQMPQQNQYFSQPQQPQNVSRETYLTGQPQPQTFDELYARISGAIQSNNIMSFQQPNKQTPEDMLASLVEPPKSESKGDVLQ